MVKRKTSHIFLANGQIKQVKWDLKMIHKCRTAPLTSKVAFHIFIEGIYLLSILNMVYTLRFFSSSKCGLFHKSNVFGSCIIHILYTGRAKIKKIIPAPKGSLRHQMDVSGQHHVLALLTLGK